MEFIAILSLDLQVRSIDYGSFDTFEYLFQISRR